jgi:ABC-type branched-subunit amino acid transport system ATPase component
VVLSGTAKAVMESDQVRAAYLGVVDGAPR